MRNKIIRFNSICMLTAMTAFTGGTPHVGLHSTTPGKWYLLLKRKGQKDLEVARLPADLSKPYVIEKKEGKIHIRLVLQPHGDYTVFKATATSVGHEAVFFSLERTYSDETPCNFNGEVKGPEIFRQSPHDVDAWITDSIAKQAVPVIALRADTGYIVAFCGTPANYHNFTSQAFYTNEKKIALRSGDDGTTPGLSPYHEPMVKENYNKDRSQVMSPGKVLPWYHDICVGRSHVFEGLIFRMKADTGVAGLRRAINRKAAAYFSHGRYSDYFGALAFTTAYMNLRVNETGKSRYWIVPSVEYANTQYCRDAFWISTLLPPAMEGECLRNELKKVNTYAEYPLMTILWAYRCRKAGTAVDLLKIQAYVDSVESRAREGYFYSYTEKDGRLDFQYWGDVMAFDKDDVITYNQGLFALALQAAVEMGLRIRTDASLALRRYRELFDTKDGYFPISKKKKDVTGPDPLVPDLLSLVYFHRPLVFDDMVQQHYKTITGRLKTLHGYKVVAQPGGAYLRNDQYDVAGYISQANRGETSDGQYFRGGSFFLYDNLFLIDAYLHGIRQAEDELCWRVSLDFTTGGTTYECLNTVNGEPWKPNMGWNVAIYSFWRILVDRGKATDRLFKYIDSIGR